MIRFGVGVSQLERHASTFTLEALEPLLPSSVVSRVLRSCGRAGRRCRDLPAELTVHLVVAAGLWRSQGMRNVLASLGRGACRLRWMEPNAAGRVPTSGAISRARGRLGVKPLRRLFRAAVDLWRARPEALPRWKGMPLVAIDGTAMRMPDTPQNRAHFGAHRARGGRATAFPFARVVVAMCALSHVVLACVVGRANSHEVALCPRLLRKLPSGALLLLDRGFFSYALFVDAIGQGNAFVARARSRLVYARPRRRLGPGDWLVTVALHRSLRRRRPDLPRTLELRAVAYRRRGFRPVTLLTSLVDARAFPAEEIVARYRDRWEVELGFDEIKTHMLDKHVPLRSKSPALVRQEIDGVLLAYNVVRMHMAEAGRALREDPRSLSFTDALERLRGAIHAMARAPARRLPEIFREYIAAIAACRLPPRRPRRYPRSVKCIPNYYPIRKRGHAA